MIACKQQDGTHPYFHLSAVLMTSGMVVPAPLAEGAVSLGCGCPNRGSAQCYPLVGRDGGSLFFMASVPVL